MKLSLRLTLAVAGLAFIGLSGAKLLGQELEPFGFDFSGVVTLIRIGYLDVAGSGLCKLVVQVRGELGSFAQRREQLGRRAISDDLGRQ